MLMITTIGAGAVTSGANDESMNGGNANGASIGGENTTGITIATNLVS